MNSQDGKATKENANALIKLLLNEAEASMGEKAIFPLTAAR